MAEKKIKPKVQETAETTQKSKASGEKKKKGVPPPDGGVDGGKLKEEDLNGDTLGDMNLLTLGNMTVEKWRKLKKVFFLSSFSSVVPFLKDKGLIEPSKVRLSGYMARATKGWAKEKHEVYEEQIKDIRLNFREQAEEYVREIFIPLKEAKQMTLNAILERLATHRDMGPFGHYLKLGDLIQILQTIKTELGEPTSIGVSKNLHGHVDINKLLEYAEKTDTPISPRALDEAIYGAGIFDGLPQLSIDGRVQGKAEK